MILKMLNLVLISSEIEQDNDFFNPLNPECCEYLFLHSSLGRLIISLVRPVIEPLRKLNLQFGGLDFTVWVALVLIQFIGTILTRLVLFL